MRSLFLLVCVIFPHLACAQLGGLKIAFNVYADTVTGNYDVFVMNTDGSQRTNITNHPGIDWVYYAHGNKLYFASDRDTTSRKYQLFEMNADGTGVRKITNFVVEDSFLGSRKDGTELIVSSRKDGARAFYIIDLNGQVLSKITPPDLEYISDPMFLPDGKQIVFRGCRQSPFKARLKNHPSSNDELYIINEDGTGMSRLTTYPPADTTAEWHSYHAGPPRWDPKNKMISYPTVRNGKLALMRLGIKNKSSSQFVETKNEPGWHDWSPDGKWLILDISSSEGYDIYLLEMETKLLTRLTTDWRTEQCPVFVKSTK